MANGGECFRKTLWRCLEKHLAARFEHNDMIVIAKIIQRFIVVSHNLCCCQNIIVSRGVRVTDKRDIIPQGRCPPTGGIDAVLGLATSDNQMGGLSGCKFLLE